jgi:hypothetical protein
MTSNLMSVSGVLEYGLFYLASVLDIGATRMEITPFGGTGWVGNVTRQKDTCSFFSFSWVGFWHC